MLDDRNWDSGLIKEMCTWKKQHKQVYTLID